MTYHKWLPDDTNQGNSIEVEWCGDDLDLTAEYASEIYGEGRLTLSREQAKLLLEFLKEGLE